MRVQKIKNINIGSFKNYQWNNAIPNFHDNVNILLGWNGAGKTIISRLLRAYEKGKIEPQDKINGASFSVAFNSGDKRHNELGGFGDSLRVFNEDYIQEVIGKTHLDYVVALGKTEVDFSKKQEELDIANTEFSKRDRCKNEHDEIAQKTAEEIRKIHGIANIRKDPSIENNGLFTSYNKASFIKRIDWLNEEVENKKNIADFLLSEEEMRSLKGELSNMAGKESEYKILKKWNDWIIEKIKKINWSLEFIPTYEKSERLNNYESGGKEEKWIRDGVEIHKLLDEKDSIDNCLFCNSPIENKEELLKHFSNDVLNLNNALEVLEDTINSALSEISFCKTFYTGQKRKLEDFFNVLKDKVSGRKKDLLKATEKVVFENLFDKEEIFDIESTAWKVEIDYVSRKYEEYNKKKEEFDNCIKIFQQKQDDIKKIKAELLELKKEARNIKIPADRINKLLEATFPYKKIELDDSDEEVGYMLKRDGVQCSFNSLSEGERNFLALAYFLISINDEDKKIDEQSIIVIDDPVSSLDSDSLFQVYAIIFGEIENHSSRQYFILTHNLDFFGHLIQNYKDASGKIKNDLVNFFQVKLEESGSIICELSDCLVNYRSDYQYAISKLYEIKDSQSLDDNILSANLLRRVLETFLHFKYGCGDLRSKLNQLYSKCKKVKLENSDPAKKHEIEQKINQEEKAMYRFINHGSHEFLGIEKYDISVLQGSKQRIESFLDIVKTVDKDHYNTFILRD